MIHFRTDLATPPLDRRTSAPRPAVVSPFAPGPSADQVSIGSIRATSTPVAAPSTQEGPHPALRALEVPREALQKAALHRTPDPGEFLMAGQSTLDPHTRKHFPGAQLLAGLCLAAGMLMTPLAAQAQTVMPATLGVSSTMSDQMSQTADLARSLGVSPTILQSQQTASALGQLAPDVREMYRTLAPEHKKLIVEKLHDTSGFLFIRVQNRDAFIQGSAGGVNAFDHMKEVLRDTVKSGKLDQATASKLSGAIDSFRTMTPDQRAAVVNVLEADVANQ